MVKWPQERSYYRTSLEGWILDIITSFFFVMESSVYV
jgi:hypothetical protein